MPGKVRQYIAKQSRTKTGFVWDGQSLAAENKSGEVNTYTYDQTGIHIANQGGTVTLYYKDFHGNILGKTDINGLLLDEYAFNMDLYNNAVGRDIAIQYRQNLSWWDSMTHDIQNDLAEIVVNNINQGIIVR